jgi:hypothetical protein
VRVIARVGGPHARKCLLCADAQQTVATFIVEERLVEAGLCARHSIRLRRPATAS